MKNISLIIITIILIAATTNAQKHDRKMRDSKFRDKIEQLEKLKLIEVLKLDEETTLRFFSRQSKNREEVNQFHEQKEDLVDMLENYFTSGVSLPKGESLESINRKIVEIEKRILSERSEFLKSLNDILTVEQVSKLIVFESRFRKELRDMILEKRGGGPDR